MNNNKNRTVHTNTLQCVDCETVMSPAEAYGPDRDTCPNPSCRGDLTLTDKGRKILRDEILEQYLEAETNQGDQ